MVDSNSLTELSSLSQKLNKQSDELNKVIVALNDQLAALNLGLQVWLEGHPLHDSGPYLSYPENEDYNHKVEHRDTIVLGYCKVDDKWQIAVKEETTCDSHDGSEPLLVEAEIDSLLNKNRQIRLVAANKLDALVSLLIQKARQMLESTEAAMKLAAVR